MAVRLPKEEYEARIKKLAGALDARGAHWDAAVIVGKVNQFYFTGTMQDGALFIKRDGTYAYFARRSIERARLETPLDAVYPMTTYRDAAKVLGENLGDIYIEEDIATLSIMGRLRRCFTIGGVMPLDRVALGVRAIKTPYEMALLEESGRQHAALMERVVPSLLREGISEAEFTGALYAEMIKLGYHGVSRFCMFEIELIAGQIGFGENSLYPTCFDGPGGMKGMSPAVPFVGSRERTLRRGDLVFVDIGYGVDGYHTDKTQLFMYKARPSDEAAAIHRQCMDICAKAASLLKPGALPEDVFSASLEGLDAAFLEHFMGFGARRAGFLGHGVGLYVDELPVIAGGFKEPLAENMLVALEPKRGLRGVGLLGVEETFAVTPAGGRCLTGGAREIIVL